MPRNSWDPLQGSDWFNERYQDPTSFAPISWGPPDPMFDRAPVSDRDPIPDYTPPPSSGAGSGVGPGSGQDKTQWEKDFEEFKKIWEAITGMAQLPDFAEAFSKAFGSLPGLDLEKADYRGLQDEAMAVLDDNLAAAQARMAARGIGRSGMMDSRGRSMTSQVLGQLARDINQDKLARTGLMAQDLASRRNIASDTWRTLFGGALAQQGSALDVWKTLLASKAGQAQAQSQNQAGMAGSFLSFLGTLLGAIFLGSDQNSKDIKGQGGEEADRLMDALRPMVYNYKGDDRERLGVMAQDVEKVRPDLVVDTPAGRVINVPQATGAVLASLARLNERVKMLEARNG